ncbi:MAG: hypothetical protein Q4E67_03220 [Planctomycetia bacterium]|nr:hypothetical protein [Planctomycetia bacterium]
MGKTRVSPPPTERRPVYVRRGNQEGRVIPGASATYTDTVAKPPQPAVTSSPSTPSTRYSSAEIAKGGWIPVTPEREQTPTVATGSEVSHTAYYLNWQKVEEAENGEKPTSHVSSEPTRISASSSSTSPVSYQSEFAYEKIVPKAAAKETTPATSPTTFFTKTFRGSPVPSQMSRWDQKKAALSATFHTPPTSPPTSEGWLVTTTQKNLPTPPVAANVSPQTAVGSQAAIPAEPVSPPPQPSAPVELAPGILDLLSLPEKD